MGGLLGDPAHQDASIGTGLGESPQETKSTQDPAQLGVYPPPLSSNGQLRDGQLALETVLARRKTLRSRQPKIAPSTSVTEVDGPELPALAVSSEQQASPMLLDSRDRALRDTHHGITGYRIAPRKRSLVGVSFLLLVCVPTLAVSYYFACMAKKDYSSEFRFSVIEQTTALPSASQVPTNSLAGGSVSSTIATVTAALTGGASQGNGSVQNFIVVDYAQSPAAVDALERKINLSKLLHKGDDPFVKYPENPSQYELFNEWQRVVSAYYDPISSLAYVKVRAFTPDDSLLIAKTLMKMSEDLVNKIANRGNDDAVKYASDEVVRTRARVTEAAALLKDYRNGDQVIDPTTMAVAPNIALVTNLRQNVSTLETQLDSLKDQKYSRSAPTFEYMASQLKVAKSQLQQVEQEVKGARAGKDALSSVVGRYELLDLGRQYANLAYTNAMLALDQTRANAAAQHIYLTPYSEPIMPRVATGPNVIQATIIAFLGIALTWLIVLMVWRSVSEARI